MSRFTTGRMIAFGAFIFLLTAHPMSAQQKTEWTWKDFQGKTRRRADLDNILREHRLWQASGGGSGTRAQLSAFLDDADLSGAELFDADLSYAGLSHANLSHSNLSYARLPSAFLREADLTGADCGTRTSTARTWGRRTFRRYNFVMRTWLGQSSNQSHFRN
jgi:hypothetical protein